MPPDPPPVPIAAHVAGPAIAVQFDQVLIAGPIDIPNWFVRVNNLEKNIIAADAGAHVLDTVDLTVLVGGLPNPGPDVVSYSPPPFDVLSLLGLPAVAFTDFPIT